jgi:hypothetical protein
MDLKSFLDSIYGPLPKSYCLYFKVITILTFIMFVLSLMVLVLFPFTGKNTLFVGKTQLSLGVSFAVLIGYFVEYLTARLLYTMCNKSLE